MATRILLLAVGFLLLNPNGLYAHDDAGRAFQKADLGSKFGGNYARFKQFWNQNLADEAKEKSSELLREAQALDEGEKDEATKLKDDAQKEMDKSEKYQKLADLYKSQADAADKAAAANKAGEKTAKAGEGGGQGGSKMPMVPPPKQDSKGGGDDKKSDTAKTPTPQKPTEFKIASEIQAPQITDPGLPQAVRESFALDKNVNYYKKATEYLFKEFRL